MTDDRVGVRPVTTEDEIRAYWEARGATAAGAPQATTDDIWLRELEVRTLHRELRDILAGGGIVADLGCGDGRTVLRLASEHTSATFIGVDYSAPMIEIARSLLAAAPEEVQARVRFDAGDITRIGDVLTLPVDVAMTDRCLINLASEQAQLDALARIAACLRPGGRYIAIENFVDGHEAMNGARALVGLDPIPVRWHNRFLDEGTFLTEARRHFATVEVDDFSSSYYLVTRVAYSAMCKATGTAPDYQHELHRIAVDMPPCGRFSPIRLARMVRSTDPS